MGMCERARALPTLEFVVDRSVWRVFTTRPVAAARVHRHVTVVVLHVCLRVCYHQIKERHPETLPPVGSCQPPLVVDP